MAIYMKMGKIEGNVTAKGYEKLIECHTAQFGTNRHIAMSVGSGREREVSRPSVSEILVTKDADKSTPYLYQESVVGKAIDEVEIRFTKTSNDAIETYMFWILKDVLVSSYSMSGIGGDAEGDPMEVLSLAFTKIEVKYHPRKKDNTLDSAIPAAYDLSLAAKP